MPLERLAPEPLSGSQVAPLAEPEFNRVAMAVDRAVEIPPVPADFDISLVHMPSPAHGSLAPIELLKQQRGVVKVLSR